MSTFSHFYRKLRSKKYTIKKDLRLLVGRYNFKFVSIAISVLFLWFAFERLFLDLLIDNVVIYFEFFELSTIWEILLFTFFVGIISFRFIRLILGYNENQKHLWISLPFLTIYAYYRLIDLSVFSFFKFSFFGSVAYLDFLLVELLYAFLSIGYLNFRTVLLSEKRHECLSPAYEDDIPWSIGCEDKLNRLKAAESLSEDIIRRPKGPSYAYGIVGNWGDGKTSFLNMVEKNLREDNRVIIIHFNPWKSYGSESIIKDFFLTLKTGLKLYSSDVLPSIDNYLRTLLNLNDSRLLNLIRLALLKENDTYSRYDEVNSAIKKIGKKIVIFIDDLDRLDSDETIQIIKIIRNSANFTNTIFIAAYDKGYLNTSIKKFSEYKHTLFAEKIFQYEILLPSYPPIILENELKDILKKGFPEDVSLHQQIDSIIRFETENLIYIPGVEESVFGIEKLITNLRDVKRIATSLIKGYSPIKHEVSFHDMFYLVLLKVKYYEIYSALKAQMVLKSNPNNFSYLEFCEKKFEDNFNKELKFNEWAKHILNMLFPSNISGKSSLNIAYVNNFATYFTDQLFEKLSRGIFNKAMAGEKVLIKSLIGEWLSDGYLPDILEYLDDINLRSLPSSKEFENFLEMQFELIEHNKKPNIHRFINNFEHPSNVEIAKLFYKGVQTKVQNLLTNKLQSALYPYRIRIIVRELIANYHYAKTEYDFFISKKDLQEIVIGYLRNYLDQSDDLDNDGMWLYYSCIDYIDDDHKIHLLVEASKVMKKFIIDKNANFYLDNFIVKYSEPDEGLRKGEAFVESIFGSYEEFERFIFKEDISYHGISKLHRFYKEYKENNFRPIKWVD